MNQIQENNLSVSENYEIKKVNAIYQHYLNYHKHQNKI